MALTPADILNRRRAQDAVYNPIEAEIIGEKASSLGHHGRLVEKAMAALNAFDPSKGTADERLDLVRDAARQVWAFFVQRELCGLRDQKEVIRHYGIPPEVLVRLGAVERR